MLDSPKMLEKWGNSMKNNFPLFEWHEKWDRKIRKEVI